MNKIINDHYLIITYSIIKILNKIIVYPFIKNLFTKSIYTSILLFSIINYCNSQNQILSPEQHFVFFIPRDTILSWPETIIPESITWDVNGEPVQIEYALSGNRIIPNWKTITVKSDSVRVNFKVLPYAFHEHKTLWDSTQIRIVEGDVFYNPKTFTPQTSLFQSSGLEYDGALTRGFSLGNNQSLVFDSELNLQLNGNIGDGYQIKAAITDQNLPIQADGTTRQLQEFDKVYIQIDKDQHSILAGDFDALNPQDYFMRYNRKLKGAQYSYNGNKIQEPWNIKASAAISRGKFTRQNIIPTEGNQGPYPLKGENGEIFIIILAGSEKVYLDGQLLSRGEDADYIMDYNQSEITFTRKILINVRHRITIEFEYAQFNYQKSQNTFEASYQKNKLESFIHYYQEKDSKSVTGDLELTPEDLSLLKMAGDAGDQFQKTGIRESTEGFNSNLILYASIDTIVNNVNYTNVVVWSTNPEKAHLIVNFSEVGQGSGDYIISPNPSPNGRVYQWVAPDAITGERKGNFAPVIPLQVPQQKQMLTGGGVYHWSKNGKLTAEIGLSRHDLNRYSSLNDDDNNGSALKVTAEETYGLGKSWNITPSISYEGASINFRPLDPYRNPEFARDWSLQLNNPTGKEQLPSFGLSIGKGKSIMTRYKYEGLFRSGVYNGRRHTGQLLIDTSGWKVDAVLGILDAKSALSKSRFFRPAFTLERVIRKSGDLRLGMSYFQDRNEVRNALNDSLNLSSFIENKMSFFIKNNPDEDTHFSLSYNRERPKLPIQNKLVTSEKVNEWNLSGQLHHWKDVKMEYTIKHRSVEPTIGSAGSTSRNLLGRIDIRTGMWRQAVKWSAGYEIGNGQEPKTEYKYIKVQKGEGNYIWVDNGNGIEEINEFEISPFTDQGEYIRLLVFNNEYIRTRALGVQQSLYIDLKQLKQQGWISKISALSTYQLSRKIREDKDSPYWNPFYQQYADTSVLTFSNTWRNIFYWNRSSTNYDIQLGQIHQKSQVLQTSGFELRQLTDFTLRWRISLKKKMDMVLNARKGMRSNTSQYFADRTYALSQIEAGPELNVILKDKFRVTGSYQYLSQENIHGAEKFSSNKLSLESVWRRTSSSDIRAQVSMVLIDYTSVGNAPIDFAILQGLQNGSNLLWSLQFNTRLNESLVLTIQYNGRKTGDVRTIHTGSAQVRANF